MKGLTDIVLLAAVGKRDGARPISQHFFFSPCHQLSVFVHACYGRALDALEIQQSETTHGSDSTRESRYGAEKIKIERSCWLGERSRGHNFESEIADRAADQNELESPEGREDEERFVFSFRE